MARTVVTLQMLSLELTTRKEAGELCDPGWHPLKEPAHDAGMNR